MKKHVRSERVLNTYEVHAIRLNKIENDLLQRNIESMNDNLQDNLVHLQRQAEDLRYYYRNIVQVVKPNQSYQPWQRAHIYQAAQNQSKNSLGLMFYAFTTSFIN